MDLWISEPKAKLCLLEGKERGSRILGYLFFVMHSGSIQCKSFFNIRLEIPRVVSISCFLTYSRKVSKFYHPNNIVKHTGMSLRKITISAPDLRLRLLMFFALNLRQSLPIVIAIDLS